MDKTKFFDGDKIVAGVFVVAVLGLLVIGLLAIHDITSTENESESNLIDFNKPVYFTIYGESEDYALYPSGEFTIVSTDGTVDVVNYTVLENSKTKTTVTVCEDANCITMTFLPDGKSIYYYNAHGGYSLTGTWHQ